MASYLTVPHVYSVPQLFRDSFDAVDPTCLRRNNKGYFAGVWKQNATGIFETRPNEKKNTTQLSDIVSVQYSDTSANEDNSFRNRIR
jgi:hypothetical protein